jgi:hypothetical protein
VCLVLIFNEGGAAAVGGGGGLIPYSMLLLFMCKRGTDFMACLCE